MAGAGRFAPSPTGPLHLGSLLTAAASWLDARASGRLWHLRFDDLDADRTRPESMSDIQRSLEAHALFWDGAIRRQSLNRDAYVAALNELRAGGHLFRCTCTRRNLPPGPYPGTCRERADHGRDSVWRFRVDGGSSITFTDTLRGAQTFDVASTTGDFVVRRRDATFAYALATAVDDGADDVTHVVRGRDLLDHTATQLLIMDALGLSRPVYGHLPLLVNAGGQKLSKQSFADPLDPARALANLRAVLSALGQASAHAPAHRPADLLAIAQQSWDPSLIPQQDIPTTDVLARESHQLLC